MEWEKMVNENESNISRPVMGIKELNDAHAAVWNALSHLGYELQSEAAGAVYKCLEHRAAHGYIRPSR